MEDRLLNRDNWEEILLDMCQSREIISMADCVILFPKKDKEMLGFAKLPSLTVRNRSNNEIYHIPQWKGYEIALIDDIVDPEVVLRSFALVTKILKYKPIGEGLND
jgi:hypothetical protein